MKHTVYMYEFPNGMIYIGMTSKSIQHRKDCGYQHNDALRNAIQEYGWSVTKVTVLAEADTREEAFAQEEEMIARYNATNPNIGYNISPGGKATYKGLKHTNEYRKRMSDLYKGKVFSEITLSRMKDAHRKERVPVIRISPNGETKEYESLSEAAADIDGYKSNISRASKGNKKYKGFSWVVKGGEVG